MNPETLFLICNNGVLPAWLLLVVAPSWSWTQRIVHAVWIPTLLGAVYLGVMLTSPPAPVGGGMTSLQGIVTLFGDPHVALIGWVHYLAFDLFVGAWEARDAKRCGISHLFVVPCLLMTLMIGPVGLLAYLALRYGMTRELSLDEGTADPR